MPMLNIIENSDVYSKTSGTLWQYYIKEPALDNDKNIIDFSANNSVLLRFKQQITVQTRDGGTKNGEIMVPYLEKI